MTALEIVDQVVIGDCDEHGLDFKEHFLKIRPTYSRSPKTTSMHNPKSPLRADRRRIHVLPKTPPQFTPVSTSSIVRNIRTPAYAPLRVDFGGGWLDVPRHARKGAFIVNCAISPLVSLTNWGYEQQSGLGGSGAWAC